MGRLTIERLLSLCFGAALVVVGSVFLYRGIYVGSGVFVTWLPLFGLFLGGCIVVDSLQGEYEFGRISSVALGVVSVPTIGIGLYAIAVYVRNSRAIFSGIVLMLGTAFLCVGVVMLFVANAKIGFASRISESLG
jgi:hypothetical protein